MKFIKLPYTPSAKSMRQIKFGGLDRTPGAPEGAISDMKNITSSSYPVIARRPPRSVYSAACAGADDAIFGTDGTLYYIKDGVFYAGGTSVGATGAKKMCLLGNNYVVVSEPGFAIYNKTTGTLSASESTRYLLMEEVVTPESTETVDSITISPDPGLHGEDAFIEITAYDQTGVAAVEALYDAIDTHGCTSVIFAEQRYDVSGFTYSNGTFSCTTTESLALNYDGGELKFELTGGGYSAIEPSSTTTTTPAVYHIGIHSTSSGATISAGDTDHNATLQEWYDALDDYVGYIIKTGSAQTTLSAVSLSVTDGLKTISLTWGSTISVSNSHGAISVWSAAAVTNAPDLSNVFQHGNRLWGTSGNTIYASKLGDPYSWYTYAGISTDSWALEVASPGEFSAGFSYGGYPHFFKERTVITVYGRQPDEFYTDEDEVLGVQSGSERSVCAVGGYVYYVSEQGVCRWGGGASSRIISRELYDYISSGVAGTDGRKYYLSCLCGGERMILVYDTLLGMWHKEDDLDASKIFPYERALYALTSGGVICIAGGTGGSEEYDAYVEFADIHSGTDEPKTMQKYTVRAEVAKGATMYIYVSYDGGERECECIINAGDQRTVEAPIIPRRHERMKIFIECDGDFTLYSINHYYLGG